MRSDAAIDEAALRALSEEIVLRHGLYLEDFTVKNRGVQLLINVCVDLPEEEIGSVDLDTVTDVSRDISEHIDSKDSLIGDVPSTLEVTTPGVFRPLTELRHFKRVRTRMLEVTDVHGRELLGRLTDVEGDTLVFEVVKPPHQPRKKGAAQPQAERIREGVHRMPWTDVRTAQVHLEFR